MTNEIITATAVELGRRIAAREQSSEEITQAHLDRIEQVEPHVNAFITVAAERALEQAKSVDQRIAAGEKLGPLAGVPIGVKDLYSYQGVPNTAGSNILRNWVPPYNATVVDRLLDAGLVIVGKTNMDEFAMGSSTETSAFGVSRNAWDLDRTAGGSSGGSAAVLAAFETPLALGTDTGGSIRQPAAFTGTVGVKPTYGGVSRYGVIAMASSLDQPGPSARNVLDTALLHAIIGGHDPMDSTSIPQPMPDVVAAAKMADVKDMRIGIVKELAGDGFAKGVEARFNEAAQVLTDLGAEVVEVSCPSFAYGIAAYYLIMPSEVSSNLARYDGMRYGLRSGDDGSRSVEQVMRATRAEGFGDEAKRRIIIGTYALSSGYYDAYYGSAQKVRTLIARDLASAFESCDVVISPTVPTTAFGFGELSDPVEMYKADLCTVPANLAGIAAGSFPVGLAAEDGLPVGLQVMAPAMADDRIYRVGAALEAALEDRWGGPLLSQQSDPLYRSLASALAPKGVVA